MATVAKTMNYDNFSMTTKADQQPRELPGVILSLREFQSRVA